MSIEGKKKHLAEQKQFEDPTAFAIQFDPTQKRMVGVATHGRTPFDVPFISHISGNLYQGGCEDGLILPDNIVNLLSLYKWESYTVNHGLKNSKTVTMYDSLDQDTGEIDELAEWVIRACETGPTLVHCQAGLNRSSLVAARALMLGPEKLTGDEAIELIRSKRSPACLCNESFEDYIRSF